MSNRKLTIYQWASSSVCAPYRFIFPGQAINRMGGMETRLLTKFGQREFEEVMRDADILIIQRMMLSDNLLQVINILNHRGIIVAYEIDDNLMRLNPDSRYAALAPEGYASKIENCMRVCQCIQCSTQALANSVSKIHQEVVVLENQMDNVPEFKEKSVRNGTTIVGYAAGSYHGHDWRTIRNTYNRVIADLRDSGVNIETWIIGDKEIFDSIESQHKKYFQQMTREDYLSFLAQIDVSIIPLTNDAFNQSKSDVKYLESASAGTPVLASDTVYGRTIRDGETGLVFTNETDFAVKLSQLVTDRKLANRIARAAHRYIQENRLYDLHVSDWSSAYRDWHLRRETLLSSKKIAREP